MAFIHKCTTRSRHRETGPRGTRDSAEVTLNQPTSCVTLSLPTTTVQELFIVITSELKRLRQQLKQTAEDKKLVKTTPTECVSPKIIRSSVKRKVTQCDNRKKETVHTYRVKPSFVYCSGRREKRDRLPSHLSRNDKPCVAITDHCTWTVPAEAGNQNVKKSTPAESGEKVNKTTPAETQPAGTASYKNNDREMSTNDRRCLHCLSTRVVTMNNCSVQTLPMTETKGINTKLKSRQTRIQLGEQVVHPKDTFQRRVKSTRERQPAAELKHQLSSTNEEQLVEVDKQVEAEKVQQIEASEEVVIKIPQNCSDLVEYTLDKITELSNTGAITRPSQPRNVCVFCQGNHHVSSCQKLQERNDYEKKYTPATCYICKEVQHDLVDCKWIQVVDVIHSLPRDEQYRLCEVCPHLKETVEFPIRSLVCMFAWTYMERIVKDMVSEMFSLPYCKVSQPVTPKNKAAETTEIKIPVMMPVPASLKYRNKRLSTSQEVRQCFFCRGNHILRQCSRYQQKKIKQKNEKVGQIAQTSANNHRRGWGNEKKRQEQDVSTRSRTERSMLTQQVDKLPMLPTSGNNLRPDTAATTERSLLAAQTTKQPSKLTRSEPEKPPIMSTAAQQEEKTVTQSTACATEMPKAVEQTSVTAATKSSEHSQATRILETEERPATRTKQKVPENSEEFASLWYTTITDLLDTKEMEIKEDNCIRCVYCQKPDHEYTYCRLLKNMSATRKQNSEICAICGSTHEMLTCKWLKLLHTIYLLNAQSQERVIRQYPVLEKPVTQSKDIPFYQFTWLNLQSTMDQLKCDQFGLKIDDPIK
ncbi:hypothetical protein BsWGS_07630 [Bradybaena similaris]